MTEEDYVREVLMRERRTGAPSRRTAARFGESAMNKISDARMDQLIQRAKNAATRGVGGGDDSSYREEFHSEVFRSTLEQLVANERRSPVDLTVSDVEKGFQAGEKFTHRDGRRVVAIHPPGYFEGEDGDSLLVQFEGVDYAGDAWDEVQAADIRKAE